MFKEDNGKVSSKRIWGSIYLGMGLIFILVEQLFNKDIEFEVLLLVIGTGAGLIGIHILKHFSKT